jgi:threonine synthase
MVEPGSKVVCVLTGNGLKDPDRAISQIEVPTAVEASMEAILGALGVG